MVHKLKPPQRLALIPQRVPWFNREFRQSPSEPAAPSTAGEEPSFLLVYH